MSEEKVFGIDDRRQAMSTTFNMAAPSGGIERKQNGAFCLRKNKSIYRKLKHSPRPTCWTLTE